MATTRWQDRREAEVLERLWGWHTCARCGVTIMLGEAIRPANGGGHLCLACIEAPTDRTTVARRRELPSIGALATLEHELPRWPKAAAGGGSDA